VGKGSSIVIGQWFDKLTTNGSIIIFFSKTPLIFFSEKPVRPEPVEGSNNVARMK
jgi:hypothetical protein